jgi:hypothetical protein
MKRLSLATLFAVLSLTYAVSTAQAAETWVNGSNGSAGPSSVYAGQEGTKQVYVCRASGIPGKLILADGKCYIGYYGEEKAYTSYQVLQDPGRQMRWTHRSLAQDQNLVHGGWENGLGLWICKVGGTVGKLVAGDEPTAILNGGKCYYGWYGQELMATSFEVLTY